MSYCDRKLVGVPSGSLQLDEQSHPYMVPVCSRRQAVYGSSPTLPPRCRRVPGGQEGGGRHVLVDRVRWSPVCRAHSEALALALGRYAGSWPGGPAPSVLVAAECRMGTLHGHAALARQWARTAETAEDRLCAQAYAEAARTRLDAIRAARSSGAGGAGAAMTADERQQYDEAARDAALSETRAKRFDDLADEAMWDGDEHSAGRHQWMAERCRESAELARQEQASLLAAAKARTGRAAPC